MPCVTRRRLANTSIDLTCLCFVYNTNIQQHISLWPPSTTLSNRPELTTNAERQPLRQKWHRPPGITACSTLPGKFWYIVHCKQAVLTAPCSCYNNEETYPDLTLRLLDETTFLTHKSVFGTSNEHFQRLCAPVTPRGVSTFARHTFVTMTLNQVFANRGQSLP